MPLVIQVVSQSVSQSIGQSTNQSKKLPVIIVFSIFIFVVVYVINVYNITCDILQYSTEKQHKKYVFKDYEVLPWKH